jgi:WD40 repeat protein
MAYDSSGVYLAAGSTDALLRMWDTQRGYATHNLRGHGAPIRALLFHPDSKKSPPLPPPLGSSLCRMTLFSASEDGVIKAWDLITKSYPPFPAPFPVLPPSTLPSPPPFPPPFPTFSPSPFPLKRLREKLRLIAHACRCSHSFEGHVSTVTELCMLPTHNVMLSSGRDSVVSTSNLF